MIAEDPPMAAIKKEEDFDSNNISIADFHYRHVEKNDFRGVSIAERRAAKCGFNASNVNTALSPPPYFTVPPGLSPSALLDSPVMLPNAEAQLSPTTGTYNPKPNHDNFKRKLKISSTTSSENNLMAKEFEYGKDECFESSSSRNEMMLDDGKAVAANHHHQQQQQQQKINAKEVMMSCKNSEDGFHWRKYGQKHVKGSEYPRSYYKCTNTNCPVTKKVERSHDGEIAEIVYKGNHNHPQPKQIMPHEAAAVAVPSSSSSSSSSPPAADHLVTSSNFLNDFPDPPAYSGSPDHDDIHADQSEAAAKKRKRESETVAVPRSTAREPKVVVQLESEVDILEDGYRWRKYGQKVVKGNPNPRSYYKCTTPNCPVRKHVERAANDIKSVITTYEGKHTHLVPTSKSGHGMGGDVSNKSTAKGKQDLAGLYLDRKAPMFNYNSMGGSGGRDDFSFGSAVVPPFPPFRSMPNYSSPPIIMQMPISSSITMPLQMPSSTSMPPFHFPTRLHEQLKPNEDLDEEYMILA